MSLTTMSPYVSQDPKNLPPGLPANLVNLIGKGSLAAVPTNKLPDKPKPPPKVVEETPQQKQAAAKLALRQQLEKTLLQVTTTIRPLRPRWAIHINILISDSSPEAPAA